MYALSSVNEQHMKSLYEAYCGERQCVANIHKVRWLHEGHYKHAYSQNEVTLRILHRCINNTEAKLRNTYVLVTYKLSNTAPGVFISNAEQSTFSAHSLY